MKIGIAAPRGDSLLLCGVPLPRGRFPAGAGFALVDGRQEAVPLWWVERAWWPDGSIKWLFLHARVSAASEILELAPCSHAPECLPDSAFAQPEKGRACLTWEGMTLALEADGWSLQAEENHCRVFPTTIRVDPEAEHSGAYDIELLEASPVAPLLRARQVTSEGLRLDHLLRLDSVQRSLIWQQRVSFLTPGVSTLRRLRVRLDFGAAGWAWEGDDGAHRRLLVPRPGWCAWDGGEARRGHPLAALSGAGGSVQLVKGWQRAPFAMEHEGATVHVDLYPETADGLIVQSGTSFRHQLRVGLGSERVTDPVWHLDPETACGSGALGPLAARGGRADRLFPGYEQAMTLCLQGGRRAHLDKRPGAAPGPAAELAAETRQDEEYFGLQHYGDWPMALGAYGGTRRMYADNEYDTPYAYFLQFLRTGDAASYEVAHWCAVHMADVDSMATDGDMRFHGYRDTADDHAGHRSRQGELGHYWTDGLVLNYLLAGDLWSWEAALAQVEVLLKCFAGDDDDAIRRHFVGCERAVGWPLTALAGVAEVTGDSRILAKMAQMAGFLARFTADPDRELEEITELDGEPLRWWRVGQEDGSKPFMLGVVLEGLERYHRLTQDTAAADAAIAISRFLVEVMWQPGIEAFIYEWNAFNRGHREDSYPHYINMLVAPGLAFAYELTGDPRFRDVATRAFHAALWTLISPGGGKEIGMVGRTSSLMVARLFNWFLRDEETRAARMRPSRGHSFRFSGRPSELLRHPALRLRDGQPRYQSGDLLSHGDSWMVCSFREPVSTDSGRVEFTVTPDWDCPAHPGPVSQRAYLHLSDTPFTRSCVSIISFYTGLHVRFYDAERNYVEVLEADIQHWRAGVAQRVRVDWCVDTGEAALWLNGEECDRRPLPRRLAGAFKQLHVGHRPGNWCAEARIGDLCLELGAPATRT